MGRTYRRYRDRVADDPTARFAALVARTDQPVPLDEALLLIAAHADPSLDLEAQRARLDELAAGVAEGSVSALCSHLFDDLGFAGDDATYYDARNSLLPAVLDRRLGIPITLAVVAMEVGRRCGVALDGIAMPGHFLVRSTDGPDRYLDVFDGGRALDPDGCRAIFERVQAGVPWDDAYLRPAPHWSIVTRVLANLAGAYRRAGDRRALCWTLELALHLPSATDRERRELGLLLGASGRFGEGAVVLDGSIEERDHEAAARLRARLN
jgi:regulator of sirC expression with transglutaminase-like and TPR domain